MGILVPIAVSVIIWLVPKFAERCIHTHLIHRLWVFHSNDVLSLALSAERVQGLMKAPLSELGDELADEEALRPATDASDLATSQWNEIAAKKSKLQEIMHDPDGNKTVRHLPVAGLRLQNQIGELQCVQGAKQAEAAGYIDRYGHLLVSFGEKMGTGQKVVHPVCLDRLRLWPDLLTPGDKVVVVGGGAGEGGREATVEASPTPGRYLVVFDGDYEKEYVPVDMLQVKVKSNTSSSYRGEVRKDLKQLVPGDTLRTGDMGPGGGTPASRRSSVSGSFTSPLAGSVTSPLAWSFTPPR